MLKLIKRYFNFIYIFDKINKKKLKIELIPWFVASIYPLIVFILIFFKLDDNIILGRIISITWFVYIIIYAMYKQTYNHFTKYEFKNKRRNRVIYFTRHRNYLEHCIKTSFLIIFSIFLFLRQLYYSNINLTQFISLPIILTAFIFSFAIASLSWFSYIIIYRVIDETIIKARLNFYIAIASTINLIQMPDIMPFLFSFSVIIVAYRWIIYFIDDRKNWGKSNA